MSMPNLLDIVKANGADAQVGLIEEAIATHPELTLGAARTIRGYMYKTLVRTSVPLTTGSFRAANEGTTPLKSTYENRTVECFIMEPRFQADKAVADAYEDGAPAYIAMEASGIMEGEMQGLAKQFYYGTGNNSKGFPGLIAAYDSTNMVIDAGGTTATTGSSCWLVKFGPKDVQWVWGLGGQLSFSPVRIESIVDSNDSTKRFDGYVQTMLARPGVQVGSLNSVVRIKKLTADSGKGLTDARIASALALFPSGIQPDVILCTRRSLTQLQASRTATNPTGAPAPFPREIVGMAGQNIPIMVTDAILNTEALTL
jgi:hypothetical protein